MAGTLVSSVISDGTNSTSTTNAIQGSAKAWVTYNGSASTIRASYNVSSVTKNTTGTYTVNFTTAFADTQYAGVGGTQASGIAVSPILSINQDNGQTTTSCKLYLTTTTSFTTTDVPYVCAAFFR